MGLKIGIFDNLKVTTIMDQGNQLRPNVHVLLHDNLRHTRIRGGSRYTLLVCTLSIINFFQ